MQVLNEIPLIVLTTNDAFLRTGHAWTQQSRAWSALLRRLVVLGGCEIGDTVHDAPGPTRAVRVQCLVLEVARVQEQGLQPERLAFEPSILDVIVRGCVVHEVLNGRL